MNIKIIHSITNFNSSDNVNIHSLNSPKGEPTLRIDQLLSVRLHIVYVTNTLKQKF